MLGFEYTKSLMRVSVESPFTRVIERMRDSSKMWAVTPGIANISAAFERMVPKQSWLSVLGNTAPTRPSEVIERTLERANLRVPRDRLISRAELRELARDLAYELRFELKSRRRKFTDIELEPERAAGTPGYERGDSHPARRLRALRAPLDPQKARAIALLREVNWRYGSNKWTPIVLEMMRRIKEGENEETWPEEMKALRRWCEQQRRLSRPATSDALRKNDGQVPVKNTLYKRLKRLEPIYHKLMQE